MKHVIGTSLLLITLTFSRQVSGQENPPAPVPDQSPSRAETLRRLAGEIRRVGSVNVTDEGSLSGGFETVDYVNVKGCVVSLRRTYEKSGRVRREEYTFDLADLDPAQVRVRVRADDPNGTISFAGANGRPAIKYEQYNPSNINWEGKPYMRVIGLIRVNDRAATDELAAAFRRAIELCR